MTAAVCANGVSQVVQRVPVLQAASAGHDKQTHHRDFTFRTAAAKAGLAPLHGTRRARSAELLVGSTPSFSMNVKNLSQRTNRTVARLRASLSRLSR